jgi:hypothetical protein
VTTKSLCLSISLWLLLMAGAEAQEKPLPCVDSSRECLALLGDIARTNNLEIAALDEAIRYQKAKRWTTFINADGFSPAAAAARIARNLLGGGERAASQLDLSNLERRRAEVESSLRLRIANSVADYETTTRRLKLAESRLEAHQTRVQIIEVSYRLGEGDTEAMLLLWQSGEELRGQIVLAEAEAARELRRLRSLVFPSNIPAAK